MRQHGDRTDVDVDHLAFALHRQVTKRAAGSEAAARTTRPISRWLTCAASIAGADGTPKSVATTAVGGVQLVGDRVQAIRTAGGEYHVDAARRHRVGARLNDTVAGPGDQRPRPVTAGESGVGDLRAAHDRVPVSG